MQDRFAIALVSLHLIELLMVRDQTGPFPTSLTRFSVLVFFLIRADDHCHQYM